MEHIGNTLKFDFDERTFCEAPESITMADAFDALVLIEHARSAKDAAIWELQELYKVDRELTEIEEDHKQRLQIKVAKLQEYILGLSGVAASLMADEFLKGIPETTSPVPGE